MVGYNVDDNDRQIARDGIEHIEYERLGRSINEIETYIEFGWLERTETLDHLGALLRQARTAARLALKELDLEP